MLTDLVTLHLVGRHRARVVIRIGKLSIEIRRRLIPHGNAQEPIRKGTRLPDDQIMHLADLEAKQPLTFEPNDEQMSKQRGSSGSKRVANAVTIKESSRHGTTTCQTVICTVIQMFSLLTRNEQAGSLVTSDRSSTSWTTSLNSYTFGKM